MSNSSLSNNIFSDFFSNKSIVNTQNFVVDFLFTGVIMGNITKLIKPYHIISIDIPLNKFERVSNNIGMMEYSIPVLSQSQQLDIRVTLEEDVHGTVGEFIHLLSTTVFDEGVNKSPYLSTVGDILVTIHNDKRSGFVTRYNYKKVYFLGATSSPLSYTSSQAMTYDITFGSDYMAYEQGYAYENSNTESVDYDINKIRKSSGKLSKHKEFK